MLNPRELAASFRRHANEPWIEHRRPSAESARVIEELADALDRAEVQLAEARALLDACKQVDGPSRRLDDTTSAPHEAPDGSSPSVSIPIAQQPCIVPAVLESLRCAGYAPGGYFTRCGDCGGSHISDKRASCCIGCADKRVMKWIAQGIEAQRHDASKQADGPTSGLDDTTNTGDTP